MQQMILLEHTDLDAIKQGSLLTLNVGGMSIMIGYANGRKRRTEADIEEKASTITKKSYKQGRSKCTLCPRMIGKSGRAPHMAWHKRGGV